MKTKTIVFEAADATGKSTQARLLVSYLNALGKRASLLKFPFEGSFGCRWILRMLKNGMAKKYPNLFQFLHFLNKWHFQFFILPNLERDHDFLVFDRWKLSMLIYGNEQGVHRKMNQWLTNQLFEPTLTFLLDGRAFPRKDKDSLEADELFQRRVREAYLQWALNNPCCTRVIEADQPIFQVHKHIQHILEHEIQ